MRLYEGMFIISDTVAGPDWEAAVNQVHGIIKNRGAEILKSEKWDERKFAYKLNGHKRGAYLLTYFNAPADSITLIKRDLQLSDVVLRALIVKATKIKEPEQEPEEAERAVEETAVKSEDASPEPVATE